MARITVEDCLEKIDNQYDLVLLAKERTVQLNAGIPMLVEEDNDKKTIISLREIGDGKISPEDLEKSAITRLRKEPDEGVEQEEIEEEENDDFEKIYKGQISKSGVAILPSKRTRKIPEIKKTRVPLRHDWVRVGNTGLNKRARHVRCALLPLLSLEGFVQTSARIAAHASHHYVKYQHCDNERSAVCGRKEPHSGEDDRRKAHAQKLYARAA